MHGERKMWRKFKRERKDATISSVSRKGQWHHQHQYQYHQHEEDKEEAPEGRDIILVRGIEEKKSTDLKKNHNSYYSREMDRQTQTFMEKDQIHDEDKKEKDKDDEDEPTFLNNKDINKSNNKNKKKSTQISKEKIKKNSHSSHPKDKSIYHSPEENIVSPSEPNNTKIITTMNIQETFSEIYTKDSNDNDNDNDNNIGDHDKNNKEEENDPGILRAKITTKTKTNNKTTTTTTTTNNKNNSNSNNSRNSHGSRSSSYIEKGHNIARVRIQHPHDDVSTITDAFLIETTEEKLLRRVRKESAYRPAVAETIVPHEVSFPILNTKNNKNHHMISSSSTTTTTNTPSTTIAKHHNNQKQGLDTLSLKEVRRSIKTLDKHAKRLGKSRSEVMTMDTESSSIRPTSQSRIDSKSSATTTTTTTATKTTTHCQSLRDYSTIKRRGKKPVDDDDDDNDDDKDKGEKQWKKKEKEEDEDDQTFLESAISVVVESFSSILRQIPQPPPPER